MIEQLFEETLMISKYSFNKESVQGLVDNIWVKNLWPLIYIISDDTLGEAYVGESTNAFSRMLNHIINKDRAKLSTLHLITCDKFNKSATLDIESNLIKYISADGKYELQNGNAGLVLHNYYQKEKYTDIFTKIWGELKKENLTINPLSVIDNSDLFKYSPYKSLSNDQYGAVLSLIELLVRNDSNSIFVEGRAGTGKTILAIYLIKLLKSDTNDYEYDEIDNNGERELDLINSLKQKYPEPQIALVIPMTSLRSTLKKVFKNIKGLSANMVIGPSDVLRKKYDILIVDEAHRLKRRLGITNYKSFDDNNMALNFDNDGNELDWILAQSKNQIFFYDEAQSIKPSDIRKDKFIALKNERRSPIIELKSQHRVKGGTDYINYIDNLMHVQFNEKHEIFENDNYEFELFESLEPLIKRLEIKEQEFGLCRLVAGYSWEWKSKKGDVVTDIEIEGIALKWNSVNQDWINSTYALSEVGCIHTTQGYDLNYTGIIFGNEISYDIITNKIVVITDNYHDPKGKISADIDELKTYIINIYKTLMFRGIKGTFVYACDKNLREYFKRHIKTQ